MAAQLVKNLPAVQETWVDPWVGKMPWRREWLNSMDYTVRGVAKSWTQLSNFHFTSYSFSKWTKRSRELAQCAGLRENLLELTW